MSDKLRRLTYPVLLVLVALTLTGFKISGSSVGITASPSTLQHSLVYGRPELIRSDEWSIATPLDVAASKQHFPKYLRDGMGAHDLAVVLDIPNSDWSTIFRPYNWFYFFLPLSNAFAAKWWFLALLLALPLYFLALELRLGILAATVFSLGVTFSPFFAWWYETISLASVGLAVLLTYLVIRLLRSQTAWKLVILSLLLCYTIVAFTLVLYPPFQISAALALSPFVIVELVALQRRHLLQWKHLVAVLSTGIASLVLLATFALTNLNALKDVLGTTYPGHRTVPGGFGQIINLASPFLSAQIAHISGPTAALVPITNASEVSSFFLLIPFCLIGLGFRTREFIDRKSRLLFSLLCVVCAVFLSWFLIGLPSLAATLLLLNRVPVNRSVVGLGLASWSACAVYWGSTRTTTSLHDQVLMQGRTSRRVLFAAGVLALTAGIGIFAIRIFQETFPSDKFTVRASAVVLVAIAAIVVGFEIGPKFVALGGALVLVAASWLPVNPLYRGLAPLSPDPVSSLMRLSAERVPLRHTGWAVVGPSSLLDESIASGAYILNAVSQYPDRSAWRKLALSPKSLDIWDRYANIALTLSPSIRRATVSLIAQDAVALTINPCNSSLMNALDVHYIISNQPLSFSCVRLRKLDASQSLYTYFVP